MYDVSLKRTFSRCEKKKECSVCRPATFHKCSQRIGSVAVRHLQAAGRRYNTVDLSFFFFLVPQQQQQQPGLYDQVLEARKDPLEDDVFRFHFTKQCSEKDAEKDGEAPDS